MRRESRLGRIPAAACRFATAAARLPRPRHEFSFIAPLHSVPGASHRARSAATRGDGRISHRPRRARRAPHTDNDVIAIAIDAPRFRRGAPRGERASHIL